MIQIDEGKIREHLGEVVRSTVEETNPGKRRLPQTQILLLDRLVGTCARVQTATVTANQQTTAILR